MERERESDLTDPVSTLSCTMRAVAAVGSAVVPFFSLASTLFYRYICTWIVVPFKLGEYTHY